MIQYGAGNDRERASVVPNSTVDPLRSLLADLAPVAPGARSIALEAARARLK